ncbi:hypothetical protein TrVE_jg6146 [Triparma verrucosa]|uniref:Uncharacterized protein n=1 Tax=Triparma verrucosa TaxID=1606542 RepID=A0A9W7F191_9STRA|nr:hypothetical protein TrVE_jg6146 [Triparma verrucosa]
MNVACNLVYGIELNISDSELLKLINIGDGILEATSDGGFAICESYYRTLHQHSTVSSLKQCAQDIGLKKRGVSWLKTCSSGKRDDILGAIANYEYKADREDQRLAAAAGVSWGAYLRGFNSESEPESEPDSDTENLSTVAGVVVTPPRKKAKQSNDPKAENDNILPLASLAILTIMESIDTKANFEKLISEGPAKDVWENTLEIYAAKPRFKADIMYPVDTFEDCFPPVSEDLWDRYNDWKMDIAYQMLQNDGHFLRKILETVSARHPFADKLEITHHESSNYNGWEVGESHAFFLVAKGFGAGCSHSRDDAGYDIIIEDINMSPPSVFTKLAFTEAIELLTLNGVVIEVKEEPRWLFLSSSRTHDY